MSAREIIEAAGFYDPSSLWLHGSRHDFQQFRRYAKGKSDAGGLFFVKDTQGQQEYARLYGDKLYRCRINLAPDEVFELPNEEHAERAAAINTEDAKGSDFLRSAYSDQRFGHLDWTSVDEEVLRAAGFRGCVLAERPKGMATLRGGAYSEDVLSLCVFDPAAVQIVERVPPVVTEAGLLERLRFKPASQVGGQVYTPEPGQPYMHFFAYVAAAAAGAFRAQGIENESDLTRVKVKLGAKEGFVDEDGRFYTRQEANQALVGVASELDTSSVPEGYRRYEALQPEPQWVVTVQQPPAEGVPGYVQIDKIEPGGKNTASLSPEDFEAQGYILPDVSNLPTGRYRLGDLVASDLSDALRDPKAAAQIARLLPSLSLHESALTLIRRTLRAGFSRADIAAEAKRQGYSGRYDPTIEPNDDGWDDVLADAGCVEWACITLLKRKKRKQSPARSMIEAEVLPLRGWQVTVVPQYDMTRPYHRRTVQAVSAEKAWYEATGEPARNYRVSRSKYNDPRIYFMKQGTRGKISRAIRGWVDPILPEKA